MTDAELAAIEARLKAATPGPWTRDGVAARGEWVVVLANGERVATMYEMAEPNSDARNGDLIAHAPTDLAALVEEVRRLKAENDKLSALYSAVSGDLRAAESALSCGIGHQRLLDEVKSLRAQLRTVAERQREADAELAAEWARDVGLRRQEVAHLHEYVLLSPLVTDP